MSAVLLAIACIASVHDGDTLRLCSGEKVRLASIDAPELDGSGRCTAQAHRRLDHSRNPPWCDDAAAQRSRDALAGLVQTAPVKIERLGRDPYGRTLAYLWIDGREVGAILIARGLARPWR